ncbi:MAG: hypothetical protein AAFX93_10495 [Verrucomicrobiota bacterium]
MMNLKFICAFFLTLLATSPQMLMGRVLYENDFIGESNLEDNSEMGFGLVHEIRAHQWSNQKGSWRELDGKLEYFQESQLPGPRAYWFTNSAFVSEDGFLLEASVSTDRVDDFNANQFEIGLLAADQVSPRDLKNGLSLRFTNQVEFANEPTPDCLVFRIVQNRMDAGLLVRNGEEQLRLYRGGPTEGTHRIRVIVKPDQWEYWLDDQLVAFGDGPTLNLSRPYRLCVFGRGGAISRSIEDIRLEGINTFSWLSLAPIALFALVIGLLFTKRKPIPS